MSRLVSLQGARDLALLLALASSSCGEGGCAKGGGGCGSTPAAKESSEKAGAHGLRADQAKQVLAKIGDEVITVGDFANRLAEQSPYLRARYRSPERKLEFLENMIRFELLALEAKRRGYEELPEIQRQRDKMLIQELFKQEVNDKVRLSDVTEEEVKAYYEAHPEEFNKPAQVRASHILFAEERLAKEVLAELLSQPEDDELFRKKVVSYSQDAVTKTHGGDLHFFSRPEERSEDELEIPPSVVEAAFSLENVGQLYGEVVSSPRGFHIVKLTGTRTALRRNLSEVSRIIQHKLWQERREQRADALIAGLRKAANIREYPEALRGLDVGE